MGRKVRFFTLCIVLSLFSLACSSGKFFHESGDNPYIRQKITELIASLNEAPDDPFEYDSKNSQDSQCYRPFLAGYYWIVPKSSLPKGIKLHKSNNNLSICVYQKRLYMAFRTAPHHFASRKAMLYVISSSDLANWQKELEIREGRDVREPHLIVLRDTLHLYYMVGGRRPWAFEPAFVRHYVRGDTSWRYQGLCLSAGEVPWDMKKRLGRLFLTSYRGPHYKLWGRGEVQVCFRTSVDGHRFVPIDSTEEVYKGGVSECTFEFDADSSLWIVTRLDDGDTLGFGSHVGWAHRSSWGRWYLRPPKPQCYMSPKLFRHGRSLYLIARRQLSIRPFGWASRKFPLWTQRLLNWISASLSPMTTSLYALDKSKKELKWIIDLPGSGDTAFPSIQRLNQNTFLIANYSSPLTRPLSWLRGQLGPTGIYLLLLVFKPSAN